MPNLPASVGRGATVLVAEPGGLREVRDSVAQLLATSGLVEWLEHEQLIDAARAVSGSGPRYLFYVVECLAAAGERAGLPRGTSLRLSRATMEGAGALLTTSRGPRRSCGKT
jgi:pyrroline-5-carboxylate reductase